MTQPNESMMHIIDTLKDKQNILVVAHIFPDGDALGSQLALGSILEALGKNVFYYSENQVSHLYEFMPGCDKLEHRVPAADEIDAAIALDCGDRYRLGKRMDDLLTIHPFIVIDHHIGHTEFGDMRWLEPNRSSTAEMVYVLATALEAPISYEAAFCLFTAIVSDTGSFKYDCTSAETFRIAGQLVDKGVQPYEVARNLFDNYTTNRLLLLEQVLSTLELHNEGQVAIITVTQDMFESTKATRDDTEDFINYPRALTTVKIAVFIKESDDGWIGVSLRAKGEYDVAEIAQRFGGGGHSNAAGFRLQGISVASVHGDLLKVLLEATA